MLKGSSIQACFEHFHLLTVKALDCNSNTIKCRNTFQNNDLGNFRGNFSLKSCANSQVTLSTTSFLTAAALVYTIGAGITAAAGTRLALKLFLERTFKPDPFQLANL